MFALRKLVSSCAVQSYKRKHVQPIIKRSMGGIPLSKRVYRTTVTMRKSEMILVGIMGLIVWTRIWYFIMMHPGHIIGGDYPFIYPEDWTDEELGIPPDEDGLLLNYDKK